LLRAGHVGSLDRSLGRSLNRRRWQGIAIHPNAVQHVLRDPTDQWCVEDGLFRHKADSFVPTQQVGQMQDFDKGEMVANDNRRVIVGGKAAMEGNVVVSHTEQHGTARDPQAVDGQGVPLDGVAEQHDARAQARRQQEENETQRYQSE